MPVDPPKIGRSPLTRRRVIQGFAAATLLPSESRAGAPASGRQLGDTLDRIFAARLDGSPERVTELGLDTGPRRDARWRLDDRSMAGAAARKAQAAEHLAALQAVDVAVLKEAEKLDLEAVRFELTTEHAIGRSFGYGAAVAPLPYVVSHLSGAYLSVPSLLDTKHPIEKPEDAEAYLTRLQAFARAVKDETARVERDAGVGVVPPAFVIDKALAQLIRLRQLEPDASVLVQSLARRSAGAGLHPRYVQQADLITSGQIYPALDEQIAAFKGMRRIVAEEPGVSRLPLGEEYYRLALRSTTSKDGDPATLHEQGAALGAELRSELDKALRTAGLDRGSSAERVMALLTDPAQSYSNDPSGRARFLADASAKIARIRGLLPRAFGALPAAELEIRRVPTEREMGAPPAYYEDPSLDGRRAGAFYLNLAAVGQSPLWLMTSTIFHESVPGHHLQQVLAQANGAVPMLRRLMWPPGYGEGWALYSEQLADELGVYEGDPLGRLGYILTTLLRACRMVVDTGIHAFGWTRERGVRYLIEQGGCPAVLAANEVERYCVWPGQACSYMAGKQEWLRVRSKTQARLGRQFDPIIFHRAMLSAGPVPLPLLDVVAARIGRSDGSS